MSSLKPTKFEKYRELAQKIGIENLFIKREDMNPSGSHKDRGVWGMMEHYVKQCCNTKLVDNIIFVISSSGNAAISAAYYVADLRRRNTNTHGQGIILHIFISLQMSTDKRQRLDELIGENGDITIYESTHAKSCAIKFAKKNDYQLLRTSVDDHALGGYRTLAHELAEQLIALYHSEPAAPEFAKQKHCGQDSESSKKQDRFRIESGMTCWDVFVPTSSGTTLQGLYEGFNPPLHPPLLKVGLPRFHIIQTEKCHTIAKEFDTDFTVSDSSLASAIVDTIGHRKSHVIKTVKQSGGWGWVISDDELRVASRLLEDNTKIGHASWDSLLSLAGLMKSLKKGRKVKNAILLFTGK